MVIFCLKVCVEALEVTVSQSSIQVARGQAAILPCSFTTIAALNNLNIVWMVIPLSNANQPEQVIIYQNGQVFGLANHLKGRVGFVATMPSTSASIFIKNTQLSDAGTYQCLVNNFPDRGSRTIGAVRLTVLVSPSVPACWVQGTLDVGSDIMLLCSSDEGIPTPTYSWEKLEPVPLLPLNAMQDQMQRTLTLRDISTSTSGLYQCTSSNTIGKSTCQLTLQVVAPQPQSVGLIAGTTATGVLAVLLCALLVGVSLCYWQNKNKYDKEEIPPEIREDDLPSKKSSSVKKAFHADSSSSENNILTSTRTYKSHYWQNPTPNYDTNSYTRYNRDTRQTFSATPAHGAHGVHGHGQAQITTHGTAVTAPGSAPLSHHTLPTPQTTTAFANGSHTLPPPKTLVVTRNSAPPPPAMRSNGSVSLKPVVTSTHGQHTHSYAVSQPILVWNMPAQGKAGSLV